MSESAAERSLHARAAALTGWAMEQNPTARTQKWRDGYVRKLEREVDPDGQLDPQERAKRADRLRRARLADASRLGVKARQQKAAAKKA